MTKKPDLSVIILNYNTKNFLGDCLDAAFQNKGNFEIVVVDNCSTDGSCEFVKKNYPKVRLVVSKRNGGFSYGNNLGLRVARGRYILFLNSDTKVVKNAFETVIDYMDKHAAAGSLTAKAILASGKMDPDCHRGFPTPWASITYFLGLEKIFPKSRLFGQYHKFYLDLNSVHEIDSGFGTFMAVRREVIEEVGAWDEDYFFYGEDLDFFYRIKEAGWKNIFYPKPLLVHLKGGSSGLRKESRGFNKPARETRLRVARASIQAMEIFYLKFYKDKYPPIITAIVITGIKIKGLLRMIYHYLM